MVRLIPSSNDLVSSLYTSVSQFGSIPKRASLQNKTNQSSNRITCYIPMAASSPSPVAATNMRSKESKRAKLKKCMASPSKILGKALDLYMKSVSAIDGMVGSFGTGMTAYPAMQGADFPKEFAAESNTKYGGCVKKSERLSRAVSERRAADPPVVAPGGIRRSNTVALERIDEDEPCDFEEDYGEKKSGPLFPIWRNSLRKMTPG